MHEFEYELPRRKPYLNITSANRSGKWKAVSCFGKFDYQDMTNINQACVELNHFEHVEIVNTENYIRICIHTINGTGFDELMNPLWANIKPETQNKLTLYGINQTDNFNIGAINAITVSDKLKSIKEGKSCFDSIVLRFKKMKVSDYKVLKSGFYNLPANWRASGDKGKRGYVLPRLVCEFTGANIVRSYFDELSNMAHSGILVDIEIGMLLMNEMSERKPMGRPLGSLGAAKRALLGESEVDHV